MLIHLEKLGKSFGEKIVLHDVTASVEREDRIGIVGQNGACLLYTSVFAGRMCYHRENGKKGGRKAMRSVNKTSLRMESMIG